MELTEQQLDLFEYVMQAHGDQKRKYSGDPYWTHLLSVAKIVNQHTKEKGLIEVALCHDLLEDTSTTYDELRDLLTSLRYDTISRVFILRGVEALTDVYTKESYPDFNRERRKQMEAFRLERIRGQYQTVKYADLIDNTKSIVEHDRGFAKKYIQEKRFMLNLMRNGELTLFFECYKTLLSAEEQLNNL